MKLSTIHKLYLSNFLTGIVFWYGIEKLFMQSIGINAIGVATASVVLTIFLVLFEIPSGILADRWSRKGTLAVSAVALAISSVILGSSKGLTTYLLGFIVYGIYLVATNGTYGAILYDALHEEGRSSLYSMINGRAYGLFLFGAGIGNIASGFIAHHFSFSASYYLSAIPCLFNLLVILSIHEPTFHKSLNKEKFLHQVRKATLVIARLKFLRSLTIVMSLLTVAELFKLEFAQLYMLRYISAPQTIGVLWAVYAFAMSIGSIIAHRFRTRLTTLVVFSSLPYFLMSFIDNRFSLMLFMVQAVAASALINQIETRIQEHTESNVRASVLSAVTTLGRIIVIPASFILGWLFRSYNGLIALRFIAVILAFMLVYWLWANRNLQEPDQHTA